MGGALALSRTGDGCSSSDDPVESCTSPDAGPGDAASSTDVGSTNFTVTLTRSCGNVTAVTTAFRQRNVEPSTTSTFSPMKNCG